MSMREWIDENTYYDVAGRYDTECFRCGYPFDQGDRILLDENLELIFCDSKCRDTYVACYTARPLASDRTIVTHPDFND